MEKDMNDIALGAKTQKDVVADWMGIMDQMYGEFLLPKTRGTPPRYDTIRGSTGKS